MNIDPIQFGKLGAAGLERPAVQMKDGTGFQDIFKSTWNNAVNTEQDLMEKQYLLSIGEIDDTHTVPIAASKAEMSLSLLVSLRNKALEAYNELMRINV